MKIILFKDIKNVLMSMIALTFLTATATSFAGTSGLLKSIQGPGFELYNKASQPITVAVVVNDELTKADIPSSGKFTKNVALTDTIRLGIFNKTTPGVSKAFMTGEITPQPDAIYDLNASGKTKYLSYTPSKSTPLYPQTGTFMGLSGKSDSGYPLGSNLSQSQIIRKK